MMLSDGERINTVRAGEARRRLRGSRAIANIWDKESKTRDRVLVNRSGGAGLTLWDTKTGVSHRWASLSPADDPELQQQLFEVAQDFKQSWEG